MKNFFDIISVSDLGYSNYPNVPVKASLSRKQIAKLLESANALNQDTTEKKYLLEVRGNKYDFDYFDSFKIKQEKIKQQENPKEINNCPPGHRPLEDNTVIKKGDIFYNSYSKTYFDANVEVGKNYIKGLWLPGFRKKDKPKIDYTEEQKQEIINKLRNLKAFNGDSAFRVPENCIDICEYLSENNIIGCADKDRFYILVDNRT